MQFSDFTSFGLFVFGGGESKAETIYREQLDALRGLNAENDPHQRATVYARATAQALSWHALQQVSRETRGSTAVELLPAHEENYGITPGYADTVEDRQRAVAAASKLTRGARYENVVATLRDILGSHFLALYVESDPEVLPEDPTDGPCIFAADNQPTRYFRLAEPALVPGTPVALFYEDLIGDDPKLYLYKDDVVVVEPEVSGRTERVTVTSTAIVGGRREFTAAFEKPHPAGSTVLVGDWPCISSTRCFLFVVVAATGALSASLRARVHAAMQTLAAGVTGWAIVQPTAPNALTCGPFDLDTSPVGAVPMAAFTFEPSF